jgi:hypothetical protein
MVCGLGFVCMVAGGWFGDRPARIHDELEAREAREAKPSPRVRVW